MSSDRAVRSAPGRRHRCEESRWCVPGSASLCGVYGLHLMIRDMSSRRGDAGHGVYANSAAPRARMLLLFSEGNSPSSGDDGEGPSHVEVKADRKVEGGDMGFTHTRAMTTVVVATFAVLRLTACSGGSSSAGTPAPSWLAAESTAGVVTDGVLPPGSLSPGMTMDELLARVDSTGMSDTWKQQAVDAVLSGDAVELERLDLQQYMGEPGGRTTPFADEVLESLRR